MPKRMSDDEVMDYTYNKLFGDLDGIRSGSLFSDKEEATQGAADNAGTPGVEGINITVKPLMAAAAEGAKPMDDEDEEKDPLKGIGRMSPLMAQLHGDR